jgi:iron(III) transport system substrate-binding protein
MRACAAALAILALAACHEKRERPRRLTLYCSTQIEWCEKMSTIYREKSGVQVSLIRKSSGEALAQVIAEKRNPKGDVWWGGTGDAHLQAAELKLSDPYVSPRLEELHEWARDPAGKGEHRTTGIYMGALGFGYNREWLARKGLPPPKRWADLVDPIYKGEIQIANPSSSGTAYTALATFVQLLGEDEAFAFLRKLDANVNQYTLSGAAPIRAAARGETGIGIVFLHDAVVEKLAGFPIELVIPEEGTGYEIGCVSVIRGARHLEEAHRFVDFVLSKEGQETGASARSYQLPSNKSAAIPEEAPRADQIKLIPFDHPRFGSKPERARLLGRWESEVRR